MKIEEYLLNNIKKNRKGELKIQLDNSAVVRKTIPIDQYEKYRSISFNILKILLEFPKDKDISYYKVDKKEKKTMFSAYN